MITAWWVKTHTRRPVVELAHRLSAGGLLGVGVPDPLPRHAVEQTEVALAQSLVEHRRRSASPGAQDVLHGAGRSHVRGPQDDVRARLRAGFRHVPPERLSLSDSV